MLVTTNSVAGLTSLLEIFLVLQILTKKMAQLREIIPEAEFAEQAGELDEAENILTRIFVIVFY